MAPFFFSLSCRSELFIVWYSGRRMEPGNMSKGLFIYLFSLFFTSRPIGCMWSRGELRVNGVAQRGACVVLLFFFFPLLIVRSSSNGGGEGGGTRLDTGEAARTEPADVMKLNGASH